MEGASSRRPPIFPPSPYFSFSRAADKAAPAAKAEKKAAKQEYSSTEGGIPVQAVGLPLSIVAIAAGGAALGAIDPEFSEFMEETSCKDSRADGAGYEDSIKADGGPSARGRAGTKKVAGTKMFGKKK